MQQTTPRRSRLAKQQNKKMKKQAVSFLIISVVFLVLFFWIGIPGLIKLAVNLGNSKASSKFNIEADTIPPAPPQLELIPTATTSAIINLYGTAEPGSKIVLYKNNSQDEESTTDADGQFSFLNIKLSSGTTTFYAKSIDASENESQNSSYQTIIFDDEAPELSIAQPTDGAEFYGQTEQVIDIQGSTDPNANVYLNDRQLVVTGDGSFSTKYQLEEGDNQLNFKSIDEAGNELETTLNVKYSR